MNEYPVPEFVLDIYLKDHGLTRSDIPDLDRVFVFATKDRPGFAHNPTQRRLQSDIYQDSRLIAFDRIHQISTEYGKYSRN